MARLTKAELITMLDVRSGRVDLVEADPVHRLAGAVSDRLLDNMIRLEQVDESERSRTEVVRTIAAIGRVSDAIVAQPGPDTDVAAAITAHTAVVRAEAAADRAALSAEGTANRAKTDVLIAKLEEIRVAIGGAP